MNPVDTIKIETIETDDQYFEFVKKLNEIGLDTIEEFGGYSKDLTREGLKCLYDIYIYERFSNLNISEKYTNKIREKVGDLFDLIANLHEMNQIGDDKLNDFINKANHRDR